MTTTPPRTTLSKPGTPPTPLHGSRQGVYDSFSPRRSTRISSRYSEAAGSGAATPGSRDRAHGAKMRGMNTAAQTPRSMSRKMASSQPYSPPKSPVSLEPGVNRRFWGTEDDSRASSLSRHDKRKEAANSNTDEIVPPTVVKQTHISMLPTPSKTPRKERIISSAQINSTARALFADSNTDQGYTMPGPKKAKRTRALTLGDLEEEMQPSGITDFSIYTDSRERRPEVDTAEDNPFYEEHGSQKPTSRRKRATKRTGSGLAGEERNAVENDEGIIYVFRGKKIFRRFNDADNPHNTYARDELDGQDGLRRMAGDSTMRHFTRSSLKPRLLFPEAYLDTTHEEEALTDIDETLANPNMAKPEASTPQRTTGLPSNDAKKPSKAAFVYTHEVPQELQSVSKSGDRSNSTARHDFSPFDSWQRKKNAPKKLSGKRPGEDIEQLGNGHVLGKKNRTGE